MNKAFYFKLLQYIFDNGGINYYCDIVSVLAEQYPEDFDYGSHDRISMITELLDSIQNSGFIIYTKTAKYNEKYPSTLPYGYEISACLTPLGFQFLNDKKRDESAILTDKSVRASSRNQTIILIIAALLSLFSLIVSWLNYCAKNDKSAQKQYLLPSKELLNILKKDTTSQSIEIPHQKEAKKPLTKKQ